jgi:hypothetical protein
MNEVARQETNMTALHAISDLDCPLFLAFHFNNHKLELDQITNIRKLSTHLVALTGTAAFPACYPNDFTVPYYPVVDCRSLVTNNEGLICRINVDRWQCVCVDFVFMPKEKSR